MACTFEAKKKGNDIMKKRGFAAALCLALILLIAAPVFAASGKDESIYASLDYDGTVRGIEVVNRVTGITAGDTLIDYGAYGDIANLTNEIAPAVSDDTVTWELGSDPPSEFYYQGTVDKSLPYTVAIRYTLDGIAVTGDALAGKSGRLVIGMDIAPNANCPENIRKNLMVQASMCLDSEKCRNIQADGSTFVVMGGYINLSYTVLPGEEASYTINMDVTDFTMQGITFNLIPYENILPGDFRNDIDELTDGFTTMADSMDEMIDGTTDLQSGLSDLTDALGDMDTGLADLNAGAVEFASGMNDFGDGIDDLRDGLTDLADGSQQIEKGLKDIDSGGAPLLQGYTGLYQQMELAAQSNPSLNAFLPQLGALNAGLSDYVSGISTFTQGYIPFHQGIQELPGQVKDMKIGYNGLSSGYGDIQSGIGDLSEGMHTMHTETAELPADVQELIDGQIEFRDGIKDARDETQDNIDAFFPGTSSGPVSFVDTRNAVNSVQYMLKTPDIKEDDSPVQNLESGKEDQGFFQRLLALFR
jgi:putative membrane protein